MTQWHRKSQKKPTGGKRNTVNRRDKRLYERGGIPANTTISDESEVDSFRIRGGKRKMASLKVKNANVVDPKTKKKAIVPIKTVVENNANSQFARRNILTKGAIIRVEINGEEKFAKVTSRPGQDANINAVLVEGEYGKKGKETIQKEKKSRETAFKGKKSPETEEEKEEKMK